ncbi:MAG: hypothetical protein QM296_10015 [Bacillota bacterium]|nr:hypothetical protein [Bacillota bacterium]
MPTDEMTMIYADRGVPIPVRVSVEFRVDGLILPLEICLEGLHHSVSEVLDVRPVASLRGSPGQGLRYRCRIGNQLCELYYVDRLWSLVLGGEGGARFGT